jgi:hypothetical protein
VDDETPTSGGLESVEAAIDQLLESRYSARSLTPTSPIDKLAFIFTRIVIYFLFLKNLLKNQ